MPGRHDELYGACCKSGDPFEFPSTFYAYTCQINIPSVRVESPLMHDM
jgi:hypothetical protein